MECFEEHISSLGTSRSDVELVQAYEILRCLGAELLGDDKAVPKAVKHLTERRAAATVRHETVEGIFKSMVQDLRREEAPERRFCPELGFSLGALRMQGGEVAMESCSPESLQERHLAERTSLKKTVFKTVTNDWVCTPHKMTLQAKRN